MARSWGRHSAGSRRHRRIARNPNAGLAAIGPSARPPQYLGDFVNGTPPPVTALTIQAYYTVRLAAASRMRLGILKDGGDVVLTAKPEPAAREHASGVRS